MKKVIALAIAGAVTVGCASNQDLEREKDRMEAREYRQKMQQEQQEKETQQMNALIEKMPDWATDPPVSADGGIYTVGSATSKEPRLAVRKAKMQAEYGLAQAIRQQISGEERSQERDGSNDTDEYQLLIDRFVDAVPLTGHKIEEQEVFSHQGEANAYVLAYIPEDQLKNIAQSSKDSFVDETSSEAFERLEERIEKSEEERLKQIDQEQ